MVTPLFKGQMTRPLLVEEDKPTQQPTRPDGSEHQYLKYSSALEQWIYPSGIDMKRLLGAGWRNGIKNGSERGEFSLSVLPNLDLEENFNERCVKLVKLLYHNESQVLQKNPRVHHCQYTWSMDHFCGSFPTLATTSVRKQDSHNSFRNSGG